MLHVIQFFFLCAHLVLSVEIYRSHVIVVYVSVLMQLIKYRRVRLNAPANVLSTFVLCAGLVC